MLPLFALMLATPQPAAEWTCTDVAFGVAVGEVRLAQVIAATASLTQEPHPAKPGARPYLIRGNAVLIGPEHNGYVAAVYPAGAGLTSGCLQASTVRALPSPPAPRRGDWLGDWSAIHGPCCSASFTVGARGRGVTVKGFATWMDTDFPMGMRDNEIDDSGVIQGAKLTIGSAPPDQCGYEMQLIGRYLIVAEFSSDACVGSNASFGGIYRR